LCPRARNILRCAIEEESVLARVAGRARSGGVGAEVRLREGDAEGGVGGEVELGVALAPVFDDSDIHWGSGAGAVDLGHVDVGQLVLWHNVLFEERRESVWWGGSFMQGPVWDARMGLN